jgi:hypothetical protein
MEVSRLGSISDVDNAPNGLLSVVLAWRLIGRP